MESSIEQLETARRQAEEALRESEERYRIVAETASDAIITIDESSVIHYINRAAEKIFGHALDDMMGQPLTMLMPEALRHLHHAGLHRYVETGHKHISWEGVELPGLHRSGAEITLEVSFGEFERGGKRYFTGIARDITERKRAEENLARISQERAAMLEEVSTPVVPVWQGILALPVIGSLDTERMRRVTEVALREVRRTNACACIIDITGARIVDSHAVANLSNLVSALRLVGAEAVVTGIGAHAAQSLVTLGVNFEGMRTFRTLAEALAALIKTTGQNGRRNETIKQG